MVLRSIYLVREAAVPDKQFLFVRSAIEAFLDQTGLGGRIDVAEVDLLFTAGKKFQVYLSMARIGKAPSNKIDMDVLDDFIDEDLKRIRTKKTRRPYYVFVLQRDLRDNSDGEMTALEGIWFQNHHVYVTVLDTPRRYFPEREIKSVTLHELGHMFGLLPNGRTTKVSGDGSRHCSNKCIMSTNPMFHTRLTGARLDRFLCRKFCRLCRNFLLRKFKKIIR